MHVPDGFLNVGTSLATGAASAGTVAVALRQTSARVRDAQVPLAGLAAAFVFAAQMVNFPVAAGTTGHLLGGALVAILLGPSLGLVVVTVVVVVQALVFADGGLTAIGTNVLNMAIVTSLGGWAVFRFVRRLLPATARAVVVATWIAAFASVLLSSMAFSLEWLFGATAPVAFDTVFVAMVGVHALIGVAEAVISALTVQAVLAVRPDLVHGADGVRHPGARGRRSPRPLVIGGLAIAMLLAAGLAQVAADAPDGLERVAIDLGFADAAEGHALGSSVFASYATAGVDDPGLSLALAGISGTALTMAVGGGLVLALRGRRRDEVATATQGPIDVIESRVG